MDLCNVFIFNKIKNNNADVKLLRDTFVELGCQVREVKNAPIDMLQDLVREVVMADFSKFNYLVIIILDNTNEDHGIWMSADGHPFHINGDLLTALYANKSLKGKLRLAIMQTNRDFSDRPPIRRSTSFQYTYPCIDVKYFATSIGSRLIHKWKKKRTSPFIRILCDELRENAETEKTIDELLNNVSQKVHNETGELPTKEMGSDTCILGHGTNLLTSVPSPGIQIW